MYRLKDDETPFYVPIFCNLEGKKVVIIGGGRVSERKVSALLPSKARIELISPKITRGLNDLFEMGAISYRARRYEPGDLEGAWLVIAATDDISAQKSIYEEACRNNCFCNVVDRPELCSFIVPSVVKRGDLCISISTSGKSPGLAKALRKRLEGEFGPEWSMYILLIGHMRKIIIEKFKGDEKVKRLERLINLDCIRWIKEGDWPRIQKWASETCGEDMGGLKKVLGENG